MFTQKKVSAVSDYAKRLTGNMFGLQGIGGDIGNGVRYIDGRQQKVWFGPRGARQAASYYLGVIDAFKPGVIGDLPEEVNAVRAELIGNGWNQGEYERGMDDAHGFMRWHLEDQTLTLAALERMPVIHQGTADNVVFNNGALKIALSRMTVADGAPYDHQVTVQKIKTTRKGNEWITVREYQAQ